jgi:hypothetical protein
LDLTAPRVARMVRVAGTRNYTWQLFDRLDDLRPILK